MTAHQDNPSDTDESGDQADSEKPGVMMLNHPVKEPWPNYALVTLGLWLVFSPFSLGYESTAMAASDVVAGTAMVALALAAVIMRNGWATYAIGAVGSWLLVAPLVFSAPTVVAYANDTLVGILAITFAVLIPMRGPMKGPDVPPGWSYNPSTALQRAPIIAAGLFGFFVSQHLAAYQLGYIDWVFEPFFGDGTVQILTSDVSKAFPVSDAGLGAAAYAVEALMGFMGDKRRWRTMPWMVTFFGIVVIPLGFTQILLIILQPVAVGTWCTLCLLSAFAMLWMIALTVDEVVAMGQFLRRRTRQGESLWHAFWMGGSIPPEKAGEEKPTTDVADRLRAMVWGVTVPWSLLASMTLGFWLMLSPAVLGTTGPAADSSHLVGALVVSFSVMAMGEPARALRYVNVLFGGWVIAAPWVLSGAPTVAVWNSILVGVLLVGFSVPQGKTTDRYGNWQKYIT